MATSPYRSVRLKKQWTNLPQTLQANSGKGPPWLFMSFMVVVGAGDGDFLFLTAFPGLEPFAPGPTVLRFFLLGSVGFMKLLKSGSKIRNYCQLISNTLHLFTICWNQGLQLSNPRGISIKFNRAYICQNWQARSTSLQIWWDLFMTKVVILLVQGQFGLTQLSVWQNWCIPLAYWPMTMAISEK